nr:sigma-70 family RNA polymerase sigma factor [Actinoplanes sp. N902-109]
MPDKVAVTESAAIRYLHQVHAPVLLAFLTRLTGGDVHRAEDLLQETLVRAWRNPEARNAEGHWNRAWLFTVARRIAIDHLRSVRARPAEIADERIEAHADRGDDIEKLLDGQEVRAALAVLPERLRATLVEIYYHGHSVAEAADILEVPPGTVKSRSYYAVRALREALAARGFRSAG